MSVAPRWKRRADEIAEAIGDELSITGTVSIGNDVTLSVATISALATAITNVLNPTAIATALWNPSLTKAVSVTTTNTTPVHVQVRNIASGFTAMASDISASLQSVTQPVSIADVVKVKTDGSDVVAISGSVNLNVGTATVPITNPNNIICPVVNSNNVTCPVTIGSSAIPVKATASGVPQTSNGTQVICPVDANHGISIPVANSNSLTVPISVGSATVPISVGTTTVPVANTNNVSVPVSSVSVVDVNIASIAPGAQQALHEATETAIEQADADNSGVIITYITQVGHKSFTILTKSGVLITLQQIMDMQAPTAGAAISGNDGAPYIGRQVMLYDQNASVPHGTSTPRVDPSNNSYDPIWVVTMDKASKLRYGIIHSGTLGGYYNSWNIMMEDTDKLEMVYRLHVPGSGDLLVTDHHLDVFNGTRVVNVDSNNWWQPLKTTTTSIPEHPIIPRPGNHDWFLAFSGMWLFTDYNTNSGVFYLATIQTPTGVRAPTAAEISSSYGQWMHHTGGSTYTFSGRKQ